MKSAQKNDFLNCILDEYAGEVSNNKLRNMLIQKMYYATSHFSGDMEVVSFLFGIVNLLQLDYIKHSEEENKQQVELAKKCFDQIDENSSLNKFRHLGLGLIAMKQAKFCSNKEGPLEYYKNARIELEKADQTVALTMYQIGNSYYKEVKYYREKGVKNDFGKIENLYKLAEEFFCRANILAKSFVKRESSCSTETTDKPRGYPKALNKLGDLFIKQKLYDKAYEAFSEAIRLKEEFAYPYNGMGNCLREEGAFNEAIEFYSEAIKRSQGRLGYAYNYLGDCYKVLENYSKAIIEYKKAMEIIPKSPFPETGLGYAYYGLGKIEDTEANYQKAIDYFSNEKLNDKAKEINYHYHTLGLARVYVRLGRYEDARETLVELQRKDAFNENLFWKRGVDDRLNDVLRLIKMKETLSSTERDSGDISLSRKMVMYKTVYGMVEEKAFLNSKSFDLFLTPQFMLDKAAHKLVSKDEVLIEVLRRWNSYTPLVVNSKGGGYFIKSSDTGIVIDPGLTFLKNFKDSGHFFDEIDTILVSHSHDDHTADLESLVNLLYKYNKKLYENVLISRIARATDHSCAEIEAIVNDKGGDFISKVSSQKEREDIKKKLATSYNDGKEIELYVSRGVINKYCGFFRLNQNLCSIESDLPDCPKEYSNHRAKTKTEKPNCHIKLVRADDEHYDELNLKGEINALVIPAYHEDLGNDCKSPVGFVLEYDNVVIIYTGDTGWTNDKTKDIEKKVNIEKVYYNLHEKYKGKKYIALIAHLGGFKEKERNFQDTILPDEGVYYKNHLGRLGLVEINRILEPDICIISEFGEEFKGLRAEIANIYNLAFNQTDKNKIFFIPADIGLKVKLNKNAKNKADVVRIEAITGVDILSKTVYYQYISPLDLGFAELQECDCLYYYDKNSIKSRASQNDINQLHKLDEMDCIQAIMGNFKKVFLASSYKMEL